MTNTFKSKIPNLYTGMISESRAYWNGRAWQEFGNCVLSSVVKCPLCRDYPNLNHAPCTCFYGAQPGLNQGTVGKTLTTAEDMEIRYAHAADAYDTSIGARLWYAVRHDWIENPDLSDRLADCDPVNGDTCCMATCCGPSLGHCPMFWTYDADNAHGAYVTGVSDPDYQPGPYLCSTTDNVPYQWENGPRENHHLVGAHGTSRAEGSVFGFMYELAYGHKAWQKKVCFDILGIEGELDISIDEPFPDFTEWATNL